MTLQLDPILGGEVDAPLLTLTAPLSFWGGVDYLSAKIIDASHPQCGQGIDGVCLSLPMVRGSGGTPGSIAAMLKSGIAPAAIILGTIEINVLAGLLVGQRLYQQACPLFLATEDQRAQMASASRIWVSHDGAVDLG